MIGAIIGKRKVRSAFDAFNKRDLSRFLAHWREDATFVYPGNLSISGEYKGKKAIEEFTKKYWERFPGWKVTVKNIFVKNIFALGGTNVFAVEWDFTRTDQEGRSFQQTAITIIHTKGGKAILVCDYKDTEVDRITLKENEI